MYLTRKSISRRAVLQGLGVAVALPLLDAMVPAMAKPADSAVARQLRFGGVYVPNGVLPEIWHSKETGRDFAFTDPMKSLEPFRQQLITVKGLVGSGPPGPHLGASCGWLNGVGAINVEGLPILSGKTFDQFLVDQIGQDTPLPSIEVGTEDMGTAIGACDNYACAYFNSIAWRADDKPLPVEINPRIMFESLFGETGSTAQRIARLRYKGSILESLAGEVAALNRRVGPADQLILADYLDNIREVERRMQRVLARNEQAIGELPAAPVGIPENYPDRVQVIYDLLHLAWQGDITRVFTFLTAVEASNQNYPFLGISESHHVCSHHGGIPEAKEKYMKIVTWQTMQFAAFVQKLKDTPDGEGSLLDHSLLYFGGGLGNGNVHERHEPAAVVVGGANGRMKGNLSVDAGNQSNCNLLLNLADIADLPLEKIGPSTGRLAI
jgi:hypothetical protein